MTNKRIQKILITSIGGDIAQAIAKILTKERPDIQLIGTDANERNAGKFFVKKFIKVPHAKEYNYLKSIEEIISKESIDLFIPISEYEIRESLKFNDEIASKTIHVGEKIIKIGLDKLETYKELRNLGLKLPWTIDADKDIPHEFPCIFKNRSSSGSKSILQANSIEESNLFREMYSGYVFQELLSPVDQEITCGVYRTKQCKTHVIQIHRELTQGQTSWGKIIADPSIKNLCEEIAEFLNLFGSINIQLINTDKGPKIFEINPRFSSTVLMRHLVGFQDLIWTINEYEDSPVDYKKPEPGIMMHKIHDVIIQENV